MKQLSKEEAIAFAESGVWKDWPNEMIAGFQLFQDKLCMSFSRFHEALEKTLGRPVFTHEIGLDHEGLVAEFLGKRSQPTFQQIIDLIPKDKQVLIL